LVRARIEIPRTAYPLAWPAGVARSKSRESARFHGTKTETSSYSAPGQAPTTWKRKTPLTLAAARDAVLAELQRLEAREPVVISTNMRTRLDGLPAGGQAEPADPGVAVYFMLDGSETCIAIDRFDRVADNLRAIAKTIEAMRGVERWGGASLVAAAFQGFQGLPAPGETSTPSWWSVLGLSEHATREEIESAGRRLAAETHPDKGGDAQRFGEIVDAWNAGRSARLVR
jgi:DnaJ-like protein